MNVVTHPTVDRQSGFAGTARHVRQRRQPRRDPAASRLSLGTLQAMMGLAAYQAHAR